MHLTVHVLCVYGMYKWNQSVDVGVQLFVNWLFHKSSFVGHTRWALLQW